MKLALITIAACLPAFGADICPWLNAATAAGFLGGGVTSAVTSTSCDYVRQDGLSQFTLHIEVKPASASHAQCGPGAVPLKAIGNEAQACAFEAKPGSIAARVVGRVRDQAFLVRISATEHSVAPKTLREKAVAVAEQVAGILF